MTIGARSLELKPGAVVHLTANGVAGLKARVVAVSPRAAGAVTVELLEGRGGYRAGARVQVGKHEARL